MNSFWKIMTIVERIMLQTNALALKRHQCQRMVAGASIMVTTTNIMVSQADTIVLKNKLKRKARVIANKDAS